MKAKEWDTRVAAGACLGLLAEQAPHAAPHMQEPLPQAKGSEAEPMKAQAGLLQLGDFIVDQVLSQGEPLVAGTSQVGARLLLTVMGRCKDC